MKRQIISSFIIATLVMSISGCNNNAQPEATIAPGESGASGVETVTEGESGETEQTAIIIDNWAEYVEQIHWSTDDSQQLVETPAEFVSEVSFNGADVFNIEDEYGWISKYTGALYGVIPKYDPGSTIVCTIESSIDSFSDYGMYYYKPFDGGDYSYDDNGNLLVDTLVDQVGIEDDIYQTGDVSDYLTDNGGGSYTITIEDEHNEGECGVYVFTLLSKEILADENDLLTICILVGEPEPGESLETTANSEPTEAKTVGIGDTINEDFLEMTIEGVVEEQEVKPSNTDGWYTYKADNTDETYVVVYGTMKNLAGDDFDLLGGTEVSFCFDDTYNYDGIIQVEETDESGFDNYLKPLATKNYIIVTTVPDELIDMYSSCVVTFRFSENIEQSYEYEYTYDIAFSNSEVD